MNPVPVTFTTVRSVPVSGAWLNSKSWENWKARYEAAGYSVVAPDWPYDEGEPADLRAQPRPELVHSGPKEIVTHFAHEIEKLGEASLLYLEISPGAPTITLKLEGTTQIRSGENIRIHVAAQDLHLFERLAFMARAGR